MAPFSPECGALMRFRPPTTAFGGRNRLHLLFTTLCARTCYTLCGVYLRLFLCFLFTVRTCYSWSRFLLDMLRYFFIFPTTFTGYINTGCSWDSCQLFIVILRANSCFSNWHSSCVCIIKKQRFCRWNELEAFLNKIRSYFSLITLLQSIKAKLAQDLFYS